MNRICTFLIAGICLLFFLPLQAQTDTIAPYLKCPDQMNIEIQIPCYSSVWAIDLIDSVSDNSPEPVELGIRKSCTGSGFPENKPQVVYSLYEWGHTQAEVWARDAAGNISSCTVTLVIQDISATCDPVSSVTAKLPDFTGIPDVSVTISGQNCLGDTLLPVPYPIVTNSNGHWMIYAGLVQAGFNSTITPVKEGIPTQGISTFDLLSIQKHILGTAPFTSPYQFLAADVNLDGKVSLYDIVLLRKLLLGLIPELPHGKSWRFVPENYAFPDPANPLLPNPPEFIFIPNTEEAVENGFYFIGVKLGDVDFSAQ